jgi:hypothetical protein
MYDCDGVGASDLDYYPERVAWAAFERGDTDTEDEGAADWLEQDYIDRHYIVPTLDGPVLDGTTDTDDDELYAQLVEGM